MVKADLTILLTTIDGLHEMHGEVLGKRLSVVPRLTGDIRKMARNTGDARFSVGGMITKLQAADLVTRAGESLWIADGRDFGVLDRIMAGEDVGTLFTPVSGTRMPAQRRYLAFFADYTGDIVVDQGAEHAICTQGRSLLPSGIVEAKGDFRRGDTVRILNSEGTELARGVTNYDAREIALIRGKHTRDIRDLLGYEGYDTVIHRNYMVLT